MRILAVQPFLRGYMINPAAGGKNKAALRLSQYLISHGHEVYILPWNEHVINEIPCHLVDGKEHAIVLPTVAPSSAGKLIHAMPALIFNKHLPRHL